MTRRVLAVATLLLTAAAIGAPALAADHVVGGTQLTLRRNGANGALALVLRDPSVPVPAPGSGDDPSSAAMVVTLFGRGSDTQASFVAPPGLGRPGWKVRSAPRVTYWYVNGAAPAGSAFLSGATLREGSGLRLRAKSSGLALAVPEGAVAVRIEMGTTRVCALFDDPAVRRNQVGRFVARDADAAGLTSCDDDVLAGQTCENSLACGGNCPGDAVCAGEPSGISGCQCVSPHQPCGNSDPACNGECPAGEECSNLGGFLNSTCACMPAGSTACGGVYPSCGDGDCPTGTSCLVDTFTCCGGTTFQWCACLSGPPPGPCPGGCPDGWSCIPPVAGMPAFCLPPTCNGGGGCGGTCGQPGTECTPFGGLCLCLTPCIGGEAAPTCGGTCADPGWSCISASDTCTCIPPS